MDGCDANSETSSSAVYCHYHYCLTTCTRSTLEKADGCGMVECDQVSMAEIAADDDWELSR
jgi:hypothetical protein